MMWQLVSGQHRTPRLRSTALAVVVAGAVLLSAGCDDSGESTSTGAATSTSPTSAASATSPPTAPGTTQDAVAAAEARVADAEENQRAADEALTAARQQFCTGAQDYIVALDRYGKLFTDAAATVGDVNTAGADLVAPRETVSSAASAVSAAQTDLASAEQELADAQAALAEAIAVASSVPTSATSPQSTTTTTIVPAATVTRIQQAEADLASTAEGITDATPLTEATAEYNSAAFALEIAWLRLVADAGCLTDDQEAEAVARVTDYTAALQTQLQQAGYYEGEVDGLYGPLTVDAVKRLQTDNGLPPTGYVDAATQRALEDALAELGQQAAEQELTQTAALQTVLTLTGYWTGPIDGVWSDELTTALQAFQTALGVEPTGAVDTATLAAFRVALTTLQSSTTSTTTGTPATAPAPSPTTTDAPTITLRPGDTTITS